MEKQSIEAMPISVAVEEEKAIKALYPTASKDTCLQLLQKLEMAQIEELRLLQKEKGVVILPAVLLQESISTFHSLVSLCRLFPTVPQEQLLKFHQVNDFTTGYTDEYTFKNLQKQYPALYQWKIILFHPTLLSSEMGNFLTTVKLPVDTVLTLAKMKHSEKATSLFSYLQEYSPQTLEKNITTVSKDPTLQLYGASIPKLLEQGVPLAEIAQFIHKYPTFDFSSFAALYEELHTLPEFSWKNREKITKFPFTQMLYLVETCKRTVKESLDYVKAHPDTKLLEKRYLAQAMLAQNSLTIEDVEKMLQRTLPLKRALSLLEKAAVEHLEKRDNVLSNLTNTKVDPSNLVHYIIFFHKNDPALKDYLRAGLKKNIGTVPASLYLATLHSNEITPAEMHTIYTSLISQKLMREKVGDILFHPVLQNYLKESPLPLPSVFSLALILKRNLNTGYTSEELQIHLDALVKQREKFAQLSLLDKDTTGLILAYEKGDAAYSFFSKPADDAFETTDTSTLLEKTEVKKTEIFRGKSQKESFLTGLSATYGKCSIFVNTHGHPSKIELSPDSNSANQKEFTQNERERSISDQEFFDALKKRALLNNQEGKDTTTNIISTACFSYDYASNILKKWRTDKELKEARIAPPTFITFSNKNSVTNKMADDVLIKFTQEHPNNTPVMGADVLSIWEPLNAATTNEEMWDDSGVFSNDNGEGFWENKSLGEIAELRHMEKQWFS